jgi:hypothetical protein
MPGGQTDAFISPVAASPSVADITRRRANQAGDRMLLHEFRHVDSNEVKTLAISNFLAFSLSSSTNEMNTGIPFKPGPAMSVRQFLPLHTDEWCGRRS